MLKQILILFTLFFLGLTSFLAQENFNVLMYQGNKSFDKKSYDIASGKYVEAVKKKDKDFGAHYNLANSLYKNKKYEEAKSQYQKAEKLSTDKKEKAAALYNLGNALMQTNQLENAVDSYKKALNNDPGNEAILKNLQIAKKKQQEKQKNQNPQEKNKENNQQNQNNKDSKNPQNPQNNSEEKQNPKNQDQGNQNQQNKGKGSDGKNQNPNPEPEQNKIPKDIEQYLLRGIQEKELETARRVLNRKTYSTPESNEKDW